MTRRSKTAVAVVAVALCVGVVAVVILHSKMRVYKTPTRAMRPTIEMGDRFLVDKWAYARSGPERWDVIVFRYPEDPSRDYVKRVVGLPGERVQIRAGDVHINGSVARKPWPVQEALWRPLAGSDQPEAWRTESPEAWQVADGLFEVDCGSRQDPEFLALDQEVYAYDPSAPDRLSPWLVPPTTWDVMVEFRVEPRAQGGAVLVALDTELAVLIAQPVDRWLVRVPLGEGQEAPEVHRSGRSVARGQPCDFPVGKSVPVQVCHVDQTVIVRLGGSEVLRHEYELPDMQGPPGLPARIVRIALGCQGGHVVLGGPAVSVDLHVTNYPYQYAINEPFALGEDEYFTVGDHSMNSNDSRGWGAVSRDAIVGKATRIFWPRGREGPIR